MISAKDQHQGRIDAPCGQAHASFVRRQNEIDRVEHPLVSIVDDDESVRESLPDLFGEFCFATRLQ